MRLIFYAVSDGCGTLLDQRNSSPVIHMAWSTTASFRATATLARLKPLRFAMRKPQAFSDDGCDTQ